MSRRHEQGEDAMRQFKAGSRKIPGQGRASRGLICMLWLLCLLAAPAHAERFYIHTDALGSVVAVTNQSRQVVERREYEPYGKQLTPVVQDGPGYTGHVQDAATGLTYMQQRYYDPAIGRFLSVDPVTADTTTAWNFNRYNYAANNPYKFTDPDGRDIRFAPGTPSDFMRNFAREVRYLNRADAANGIGTIFSDKNVVVIVRPASDRTNAGQSGYDANANEIIWADKGGIEVRDSETGELGVIGPGLALGHEFDHVMNDIYGSSYSMDVNTPDDQYHTQEERNVIEEYERPAAKRLGEPQRDHHSGKPVEVACPGKECES